ncbi:OPT oligopeptide transporter protein-domain-containing protein [Lipomyces oligophaga]|uniref:OPT oligopeptide transporter protein-domain-containing protein n=1 Tax=Lipomyces oligophaga TaxID=45792 RepID=UPI0034CE1D21
MEDKHSIHDEKSVQISEKGTSSSEYKHQTVDEAYRDQVVTQLRAMNKTGIETDIDELADKASQYLYDRLVETSLEQALDIINQALEDHYGDVNFDDETYNKLVLLSLGPEKYELDYESYELHAKLEAVVIHYHSPYAEVRAVTDPFDDPKVPVETIRAYVIGSVWVAVAAFINEFFTFRQPSLALKSTVVQLLMYPSGKLTQLLPDWGFTLFETRYSINPGPWTIKEQMLATIMVNAAGQTSNWMQMTVVLRHKIFFGYDWVDTGFVWLMNFASLFFGYGLAGLCRKLCIYPVKAVFPNVLPTLALSRALVIKETKTSVSGWTIGRQKFFFLTFGISFIYFFVPDYLFKALSTFNWMTWISPKNITLAAITGSYIGLGLNPVPSFDWAVLNYGNPLVYPFYAFMNHFTGTLLAGFIMVGLYWKNYKWTAYLPMNSNTIYDRNGATYNVSKIVKNNVFVENVYLNYSPPFMSAGNLVHTGSLWAIYTCSFVFVCISEYKLLWDTLKKLYQSARHPTRDSLQDFQDPHCKMMSAYPEVPDWWYVAIFLIGVGTGLAAVCAWPTTVSVWTVIAIFLFNIAMLFPLMVVLSQTGYSNGFGAFAVILAGYMDPGNAVTNLVIRMWGYNIDEQSESFIGDQKIAHYAKIPQRAAFRCQLWATLIQCCCTVGAVEALFKSVKDFCSPTQPDKFVCTMPRRMESDAILFGIINPYRVLGTLYPALKHAFWIGALIGIPFALAKLKWGDRMKRINPALVGYGTIIWGSTYNLSYYIGGIYFSYFFMHYIRQRYIAWWTKYNYVLTSGLSAGVAFSGIIIFAALQYPQVKLNWWGNSVYAAGVDYERASGILEVPANGFGPEVGAFR